MLSFFLLIIFSDRYSSLKDPGKYYLVQTGQTDQGQGKPFIVQAEDSGIQNSNQHIGNSRVEFLREQNMLTFAIYSTINLIYGTSSLLMHYMYIIDIIITASKINTNAKSIRRAGSRDVIGAPFDKMLKSL